MSVIFRSGGRKITVKAQVDSGNTIREGVAMSQTLAEKLGLKIEGARRNIRTAKKGAELVSLGTTTAVPMQIQGFPHRFLVKPRILQGLTDHVNLGTPFLTRLSKFVPVSLSYQGGQARLLIGTQSEALNKMIERPVGEAGGPAPPSAKPVSREMEQGRGRPANRPETRPRRTRDVTEQDKRPVFVDRDVTVKKQSVHFVPVRCPLRVTGTQHCDMMVEPCQFSPDMETIAALYHVNSDKIAILNHSKSDIYLKAGTQVAEAVLAMKKEDESSDQPDPEELQEQVLMELELEKSEKLRQDEKMMERAKELVRRYADIFASPTEGAGTTDLIEFDIKLVPGAEPVKSRPRPLNPRQEEDLRKQIKQWEKDGVCRRASDHAAWASPMVGVLKKNGLTRWCCDYRKLNERTVPDNWPLPSVAGNLERLCGSNCFSTLDSAAAYNTIPTTKRASKYLTFICFLGSYEMLKMPFGARNSASVYSRFVQKVMDSINSTSVLAYLDDVIVHTDGLEEHMKQLELTFEAHRKAGLRLRAQKTFLFRDEVDYLGHHVSADGVAMIPAYVEKITKWPRPTTTKELKTFVGFVSYYRQYIRHFSHLTNEMHTAKGKDKLEWTSVLEEKFNKLKQAFKEAPIRAFPMYHIDAPFLLSIDFSKDGLGAVLEQDQNGARRLIGCEGRKTTPYERNYHSSKGEISALIYGLRKFSHILRFKKFHVFTDNMSVRWLKNQPNAKGVIYRWLEELQSYDFDVFHKPGKQNILADSVSRTASHLDEPEKQDLKEQSEYVCRLELDDFDLAEYYLSNTGCFGRVQSLTEAMDEMDFSPEAWKKAQEEDPDLRHILKWLGEGSRPDKATASRHSQLTKAYLQQFENLEMKNGLLYQTQLMGPVTGTKTWRLVVPESKWADVFAWSHSHMTAAHFGQRATLHRITSRFYWPSMSSYIKREVGLCQGCLAKTQKHNLKDTVHVPLQHGYPNERLFIDLTGPHNTTTSGNKYILTCEDSFSRYVAATPIPNKEAVTVARALYDTWVCKHGCPSEIGSDNGLEFVNQIIKQLHEAFQIKAITTAPYSPQANGKIERFHRSLNMCFRVIMEKEDGEWDRYVGTACLAHNTKVHSATNLTPYFVFHGREAQIPLDILIPSPNRPSQTMREFTKSTLNNFTRMYQYVQRHERGVIRRNAMLYSGRQTELMPGDVVWYLSPLRSRFKPTKMTDLWCGPYVVVKKLSPVNVLLKPRDYEGQLVTAHVTRVIPCRDLERTKTRNPADKDMEMEAVEDEMAEEINPPDDRRPVVVVTAPRDVPDVRDLTKRGPGRPPKRRTTEAPTVTYTGPEEMQDIPRPSQAEPGPGTEEPTPPDVEMASPPVRGEKRKDVLSPPTPRHATRQRMSARSDSDTEMRDTRSGGEQGDPLPTTSQEVVRPTQASHSDSVLPGEVRVTRSSSRLRGALSKPALEARPRLGSRSRQPLEDARETRRSDRHQERKEKKRFSLQRKGLEDVYTSDSDDLQKLAQLKQIASDSLTVDLTEDSIKPERGSTLSAAFDVRASHKVTLAPNSTTRVDIQLRSAIPEGYCMLLLSRSGLASKGIVTEGGLIDSDYRGPICCLLRNQTSEPVEISRHQRVSQAIFLPVYDVRWRTVEELPTPNSDRRGGFGSTGSE